MFSPYIARAMCKIYRRSVAQTKGNKNEKNTKSKLSLGATFQKKIHKTYLMLHLTSRFYFKNRTKYTDSSKNNNSE